MNVTDRSVVADSLVQRLLQDCQTDVDRITVAAMVAAKTIAMVVEDPKQRGPAMKALQSVMNAQLTLESAGDHRALQPIGRLSMEDED